MKNRKLVIMGIASLAFALVCGLTGIIYADDFPNYSGPHADQLLFRYKNRLVGTKSDSTTGMGIEYTASDYSFELMAGTNASAWRTGLGLGSVATHAAGEYAASSHTHTASQVTDFNASVDARIPVTSVAGRTGAVVIANTDVSGLGTASTHANGDYAAASHTHAESDVTNLVSDLAGKQAGPLTGDVTTSGVAATIGSGKVTNAMLAGSVADGKISSASTWNAKQEQVIAGTGITLAGDNKTISVTHPTLLRYYLTAYTNAYFFSTASASVASGVATFYLTTDGTSSGTAYFPNGIIAASMNVNMYDQTKIWSSGAATVSNSNRTLTVPIKYLSSSSLITGAPVLSNIADGSSVYLFIAGY